MNRERQVVPRIRREHCGVNRQRQVGPRIRREQCGVNRQRQVGLGLEGEIRRAFSLHVICGMGYLMVVMRFGVPSTEKQHTSRAWFTVNASQMLINRFKKKKTKNNAELLWIELNCIDPPGCLREALGK